MHARHQPPGNFRQRLLNFWRKVAGGFPYDFIAPNHRILLFGISVELLLRNTCQIAANRPGRAESRMSSK